MKHVKIASICILIKFDLRKLNKKPFKIWWWRTLDYVCEKILVVADLMAPKRCKPVIIEFVNHLLSIEEEERAKFPLWFIPALFIFALTWLFGCKNWNLFQFIFTIWLIHDRECTLRGSVYNQDVNNRPDCWSWDVKAIPSQRLIFTQCNQTRNLLFISCELRRKIMRFDCISLKFCVYNNVWAIVYYPFSWVISFSNTRFSFAATTICLWKFFCEIKRIFPITFARQFCLEFPWTTRICAQSICFCCKCIAGCFAPASLFIWFWTIS